jgi:hypothetical protein
MWWIIGVLFIAWGVFAIVTSVIETNKSPSVGGAAMIATIMGVIAIVIGSLLVWVLA